jgi:hypothetical protein
MRTIIPRMHYGGIPASKAYISDALAVVGPCCVVAPSDQVKLRSSDASSKRSSAGLMASAAASLTLRNNFF